MTDYSVLSDISINALVSRKLYGEPSHEHRLELVNQVVDYCNKPDDAWSIITGNKIDINWGDDVHPALKDAVIASRGKISATHKTHFAPQ